MEGSFSTMPAPRAKTHVLAVPRSIARSLEKNENAPSSTSASLRGVIEVGEIPETVAACHSDGQGAYRDLALRFLRECAAISHQAAGRPTPEVHNSGTSPPTSVIGAQASFF